jgi:hypothetical protein
MATALRRDSLSSRVNAAGRDSFRNTVVARTINSKQQFRSGKSAAQSLHQIAVRCRRHARIAALPSFTPY